MIKENKPNLTKNLIYLIIITLLCVGIFFTYGNNATTTKKILYTEFETMVDEGKVTDVYAVGTKVYVLTEKTFTSQNLDPNNSNDLEKINKIKNDFHKTGKYAEFYTESPSYIIVQEFITKYNDSVRNYNSTVSEELKKDLVTANYEGEKESFIWTIIPYISLALLGVIAFMIIRSINQTNTKNIGFGKTKATGSVVSKVKFSDVAGADEEKQELKELVDFLKDPKKFNDLGARTPKGVLLVGPPGTGKTLLAKAVAGESNAPFYSISGSDFVEMFVGVGASRVRDLFEKAKQTMPSIIFIDEIDAVGRQRGAGLGGGNDEREQTLNQLLVQLDGFEQSDGIIVIAATNRPDVLDPALLRPGRFDRQVYVNLPDVKGREEILKVHARNKKLADDVSLKVVAQITTGFSGADLANLLNEAAILTGRDNRHSITMVDINEAIDKVVMGPQKRSHIYTERDKELTAYHESGHAILHKLLPNCDEVQEVSIIPRGMAGGYTMSRPSNDEIYATYNKLNDEIVAFMGGRVAEEIILKDISTGASNDIEQATKIAKKMVTEYGMSKLGFINFASQSEVFIGRDYKNQTSYSEKTASEIDKEIKEIIDYNYKRAKELLTANIDKLHTMAKLLLKKETIYTEQVDMIMNNIPVEDIIKSIDNKVEADKKRIEKERAKHKKMEEQRIEELKAKTLEALKKEGIEIKVVSKDGNQPNKTENNEENKSFNQNENNEEQKVEDEEDCEKLFEEYKKLEKELEEISKTLDESAKDEDDKQN